MQAVSPTPIIDEVVTLMHRLSNEQQRSALEYLNFLAWQNQQQTTQAKASTPKGRFDDVFGLLTAKNSVSIDEMNKVTG